MVDKDTCSQTFSPEGRLKKRRRSSLAEALTALGNYLAATAQISDGGKASYGEIRQALERGLSQHERALVALHRLRVLLTNRKPT